MRTLNINGDGDTKLIAYQAENDDDIGQLFLTINDTSSFPINLLSDLQCIMADIGFNNVGLLNVLHVDLKDRGAGKGKQLIEMYCNQIASKTDIDLIFARIENPQATGIDLELFYEKYGFSSAFYAAGEALMVNKSHADFIAASMIEIQASKTKSRLNIRNEVIDLNSSF